MIVQSGAHDHSQRIPISARWNRASKPLLMYGIAADCQKSDAHDAAGAGNHTNAEQGQTTGDRDGPSAGAASSSAAAEAEERDTAHSLRSRVVNAT